MKTNSKIFQNRSTIFFRPKRIFVSKSARAYPRTAEIISRIQSQNKNVQIIDIDTNTPDRPDLSPKRRWNYMKSSIVLCTRFSPFMEVFASPGRISENLGVMGKIHFHCPLRCKVCYLDVAGRGTPWTRIYVDFENFYDQAVKERLVYRSVQTLWSCISFYQESKLDKVPEKFKEICDSVIRKEVLRKKSVMTSDSEVIRYLKKNLRDLFHTMGIKITHKKTAELKKMIPEFYKQNQQFPLWINISEYSDVLALDPITNIMDELMQKVQTDPDFRIKFRTKAANINNLLKHAGQNQVQVTFGLNTEYVTSHFEEGTANLDEMITAVNSLIKKGGYLLQIAIEPIIKYEGYEDDYRTLIRRIKEEIDLSKVQKIKIGTVRYKTILKNFIKKVHPDSGLISRKQELIEPEKGDKRWRYSKEERLKIYKIIQDELKDVPGIELGLGSENPEIWDELKLNKSDIHSDVVYQYTEKSKSTKSA